MGVVVISDDIANGFMIAECMGKALMKKLSERIWLGCVEKYQWRVIVIGTASFGILMVRNYLQAWVSQS
jgi:hypothetical protein